MKSLIYMALALVMGGTVWYSLSPSDIAEKKVVNNTKSKSEQINQAVYDVPQKGYEQKALSKINIPDKNNIKLSEKLIQENISKRLEELKKRAKTMAQKEEYEKIVALEKNIQLEKIDQILKSEQAKINYERQQQINKQRSESMKAKEKYIVVQQMMKNRDPNTLSKSELMKDKAIRSYVAQENYIQRQKEIVERMKSQSK